MTTIDTRSARTGRWLLPSAVAAGVAALLATLIITAVAWLPSPAEDTSGTSASFYLHATGASTDGSHIRFTSTATSSSTSEPVKSGGRLHNTCRLS